MTVACYELTADLVAATRLHIGSGKRTGVIKRSLPYIPGSVLRGAIGEGIVKVVCKLDRPPIRHEGCKFFDDCPYTNLYGEEFGKSSQVIFRYAYPLHLACDGGIFVSSRKTMLVCENPQCGKTYDTFDPMYKCENCGGHLEPARGYVCTKCGKSIEVPVPVGRIALTAVDREKNSAAVISAQEETAGTLHALDLIEAGSKFRLEIVVGRKEAEHLELLKNILSNVLPEEGIGGSKSRGLGKVEVKHMSVRGVTVGDLEKRAEEIDPSNFTVELRTPMILRKGSSLDPTTLLEGARKSYTWCIGEGKPKLPEVKPADKHLSFEQYTGWSLKEDRRRQIEVAISPGSVFRYECAEPDETLTLSLATLEFGAMGSHKSSGCGQVRIGR